MKKLLLITVVCVLGVSNLLAQIEKGTVLLESSVGFYREELQGEEENALEPLVALERIESHLRTSLGVGYAISERTMVGLLGNISTETLKTDVPKINLQSSTGVTNIVLHKDLKIKTTSIDVGLYVQQFFNLSQKLYFVPRFSITHQNDIAIYEGFSNSRNESGTIIYGIEFIRDEDTGEITVIGGNNMLLEPSREKRISNYIGFELSGSFLYQINKRIGIQAQLISSDIRFNYKHTNPNNINLKEKIQTNIGFAPSDWAFGVVVWL